VKGLVEAAAELGAVYRIIERSRWGGCSCYNKRSAEEIVGSRATKKFRNSGLLSLALSSEEEREFHIPESRNFVVALLGHLNADHVTGV
jgi:hypothetical protein